MASTNKYWLKTMSEDAGAGHSKFLNYKYAFSNYNNGI